MPRSWLRDDQRQLVASAGNRENLPNIWMGIAGQAGRTYSVFHNRPLLIMTPYQHVERKRPQVRITRVASSMRTLQTPRKGRARGAYPLDRSEI
jgi:hypothetical protein